MSSKITACLLLSFIMLLSDGCTNRQTNMQDENQLSKPVQTNTAEPEIRIFKNDSLLTGFGYDILMNGKTYVHQPNIPAVPGNKGFSSEQAAHKTAELVVFKIKNNILPPGIDIKELDSLGVLK